MLIKYKQIIEKLNYFEWIKFLEKVNPKESSYAIAEKLDYSSKRNNLTNYRNFLKDELNQNNCFYCNKDLSKITVEVDHYVPWSFTKDDKLWNFVLACRECNNKKRDKLALDKFTILIINRNRIIIKKNFNNILFDDFTGYNEKKFASIYQSAIFNGFDYGWKPSVSQPETQ